MLLFILGFSRTFNWVYYISFCNLKTLHPSFLLLLFLNFLLQFSLSISHTSCSLSFIK
ncbi:hypothetical protein MtrunA17_Chr8g0380571 [Medicago truncatula]|uniref:Transmembrane protein n=1 Tax=Medicago truncatula TaxID=3880 RepID=A0A396GRH6_MEDTR|nr:hypothetical protein MtrunA17_Chr8g0380571 [Medicago truncatula]